MISKIKEKISKPTRNYEKEIDDLKSQLNELKKTKMAENKPVEKPVEKKVEVISKPVDIPPPQPQKIYSRGFRPAMW